MNYWQRFRAWRCERLMRRLVYTSAETMLVLAARRLGRKLSAAEAEDLPRWYGAWLCADNARILALVHERPTRVIHLFLSELLP